MLDRITLYHAPTTACDTFEIAEWLDERIDADISVKERFLDVYATDDFAVRFAEARVISPYERRVGNTMLGVIRYEERTVEHPQRAGGVMYDGFAIQRTLNEALPGTDRSLAHLHIILLDRVIGTWGDHDGRWHKRVNVLGQPAIISIPGLYEAPAKPEAYYNLKHRHAMVAGTAPPREMLETKVGEDFLIKDDPRTTDVLKGYALQAIHLLKTGEGFCSDNRCRLSNQHRQCGVIRAQLRDPEFCDEHANLYR